MAQPMTPNANVIQMPQAGERPVVSELRTQLGASGNYPLAYDPTESYNLFANQLGATIKYVAEKQELSGADAIEVGDAVTVLMEEAHPYLNQVIDQNTKATLKVRGITNPSDDELRDITETHKQQFRDQLVKVITPEEAEAEKSHRVRDFLTDKVSSTAERFSITAKKTRAAYRHYSDLSQKVDQWPAGSDERTEAIRTKKEARNALIGRFAKTTGVLAVTGAVTGFAINGLRTKGFESPLSWLEDKDSAVKAASFGAGIGIGSGAGTAIVLGLETMRNASLRGQINAMDKVGKVAGAVFTGYRKTNFSMDMVKNENEADYDKFTQTKEKVDFSEEFIRNLESRTFDKTAPDYATRLTIHKEQVADARAKFAENIQELNELEAQLVKEYGEKKLSLKGKFALGALALAAAAGGAYLINKNGIRIPFTGNNSGNVDQASTHGGGSGTSTSTTSTTAAAPTTTAAPAPTTTLPTPGNGGGSAAGNLPPLPKGVNQSAYDQLTDVEKVQFHANYDKFSGDEQKAFNHFVDGVQEFKQNNPTVPKEQRDEMLKTYFEGAQNLRTGHPQATPDQINTLMDNTIQLAEQRAQAAGSGTVAQFDEQFRQYVEGAQQQTPEAQVIRLATQRAQYVGRPMPYSGIRAAHFDEQFRQFNEAAQHQAQVNTINLAAERANYADNGFSAFSTLREAEFDKKFEDYIKYLEDLKKTKA